MTYSVAIQGGAMRSVYCLGAVRALVEGGLASEISEVYTSSAGCVSGAALVAQLDGTATGSISETVDALVESLTGTRFINERRLNRIVDVDYLVDVIRAVAPVNAERLRSHGIPFVLALTEAATGAAAYMDASAFSSDSEIDDVIRATMAIPVLYHRSVKIAGRDYIDGGIADPLPLLRAVSGSSDTVIAISSVPAGELGRALSGRDARIVSVLPGLSGPVRHLMLARNPMGDATFEIMQRGSVGNIRILPIVPSKPELLGSRLETREPNLRRLEQLGYEDGVVALERSLAGLA